MFDILSNCILSQFLSSYRIKFPSLVLETCSQSSFRQGTVRYGFQGFLELDIAMQILLTEMLSNSYLNYDRANCYTINFNEFLYIPICYLTFQFVVSLIFSLSYAKAFDNIINFITHNSNLRSGIHSTVKARRFFAFCSHFISC